MDKETGIVVGTTALILVVAGLALVNDAIRWTKFKQANDCKIVGKESGSVATAVGASGQVTSVFVPGKTSWLCKDGITYTR